MDEEVLNEFGQFLIDHCDVQMFSDDVEVFVVDFMNWKQDQEDENN